MLSHHLCVVEYIECTSSGLGNALWLKDGARVNIAGISVVLYIAGGCCELNVGCKTWICLVGVAYNVQL